MDKDIRHTVVCGEVVDIAEHTNYIDLVSRVCYYDSPNMNNDMLPYDENAELYSKSLINMPVQARYRVSPSGQDTFGSHEMHKSKDGSVTFNTVSIGTHTDVWIENDNVTINDGTIKELPCLFAKYRIWKRYPKMISAAKRLFSEGKLYSSWEISTYQYMFDNGIRKITNYEFMANTLLGYEYSYPSYGANATALSMAELNDNPTLLVAEALSQDLIDEKDNKEENDKMAKQKVDAVIAEEKLETSAPADTDITTSTENEQTVENTVEAEAVENTEPEAPTTDSAQLTTYDLRRKVSEACRQKIGDYVYIAFMFPNEKEVWCEYDKAETELDYVKFTYEVGENDTITVSEPEYVKLTVGIAEINNTVAELSKELETAKAELEIKNDAITKASEKIQELNVQISELTPFKAQVEAAEQKRIEAEIAEEKERLKAKMLKGNLFTETEIAEKNIADLIEARDESAINSMIADKFVASFDSKESEDIASASTETAETATASLESDDEAPNARSFMRKILFN